MIRLLEGYLLPVHEFQWPFARNWKNNCSHHVHVFTVRNHIIRVLTDCVVVDVVVVVIVVVYVVVDVGNSIECEQDEGHKVEWVKS